MNAQQVTIRTMQEEDLPTICALAAAEDMELSGDFVRTFVAVDEGGIAGFCRIRLFDGTYYVNPVVTAPRVRGSGLGRILMDEAIRRHGEVSFVARGYAVPFYRHIGCEEIPWEAIAPEIAADCDECEMAATCGALPMRYAAQPESAAE